MMHAAIRFQQLMSDLALLLSLLLRRRTAQQSSRCAQFVVAMPIIKPITLKLYNTKTLWQLYKNALQQLNKDDFTFSLFFLFFVPNVQLLIEIRVLESGTSHHVPVNLIRFLIDLQK